MNHTEYEVGLIGWLKDASDEQRQRFGLDLLERTYDKARPTLPPDTLALVKRVVSEVKGGPIETLEALYMELYDEADRLGEESEDDYEYELGVTHFG